MTDKHTAPSRFTSTALPTYIVQATNYNPVESNEETYPEIEDFHPVKTKEEVAEYAAKYHRRGLWVEVFHNRTKELIAGPFNPDKALPRFIV